MIGQYVRVTASPNRVGRVVGAQYHRGEIRYLFRLDSRLNAASSDTWYLEFELEECSPRCDHNILKDRP